MPYKTDINPAAVEPAFLHLCTSRLFRHRKHTGGVSGEEDARTVDGKTAALKPLLEIMDRRELSFRHVTGIESGRQKNRCRKFRQERVGKSKSISKHSKFAETLSRSG